MKIANKLIIIPISIIFIILIGYLLIYLIFPMPKIINLLPDTAMAYLDVHNFDEYLSATKNSEFVKKVSESTLWTNLKTTRLWSIIEQDLAEFQQLGLDRKTLNRLVGKHAIISFHTSNSKFDYLLVSELNMSTRLIIASGQIERLISPEYNITREKYEGFRLVTIQSSEWKYTYAFAGRAGLLATDENLIKNIIDIYKHKNSNLSNLPRFNELMSGLPLSDISFFINAEKVRGSSSLLQKYGVYPQNFPFINKIGFWAGIISNPNKELKIDSYILNQDKNGKEIAKDEKSLAETLPLPDNLMSFATHKKLSPELLFKWMEKNISPRLYIFRGILLPVLDESLAEAIIAPSSVEYQTVPSFAFFMRVRNKFIAEDALKQFKDILKYQSSQTVFEEMEYNGTNISYSSSFPGIYLPVGIGFAIIKDDLLVISTDLPTLKTIIDTSTGKHQHITKQSQYINFIKAFEGSSDNMLFVNLVEIAPIAQQFAKLYLFQGMITGKRAPEKYEKYAVMIADNAYLLQSWRHFGAVWYSDSGKTIIKIALK